MIEAHPNYRLRLPLEYQLPFWPYVTQQPGEKRWGRVVLKYMSNKIGERILFDIKELPLDEEEKECGTLLPLLLQIKPFAAGNM